MKILDRFQLGRPIISFEVFPPKRDGNVEALFETIHELRALEPDFISVTYGAGGSTRDMTYEIAVRLVDLGTLPLVHLTCVGHSRTELAHMLDQLSAAGIRNVLALRGDPPRGESFRPTADGFRYASELVHFIKGRWDLCVGVAGYPEIHPEAASPEGDLAALREKVDAGADFVTTQLFFDNRLYYDYARRVRDVGVTVPILPGIMPVLDGRSLTRFAGFGANVPDELARGFERADGESPERAKRFGLDFAIAQCRDLLARGAPGIHIYTMNKAWAALGIHQALVAAR